MKHTYPPSYGPDHQSPWIRLSWLLLDNIPPGVISDDYRFLLGGIIAGALMEAHNIGKEGRDIEDMVKSHQ